MANPLVSLCVPTRNRARHLRESLESILGQEYEPVEIVISDNASEDDTQRIGEELAASDPRVRYVRHAQNIGLHGNHNYCLDAARGEFVCICHDHDRRSVRMVAEYVGFLQAHPRVGVVSSDWELIDDEGERIGVREHDVPEVTPGLEYIGQTIRAGRSSLGIPGAMIRRAALGDARFGHDAPIGFGDFTLWARIAETWDIGHLQQRLWSWRQNQESHSARPIESIVRDYEVNLGGYCDEHLARWPAHAALVAQWRDHIRRYIFWALMYEVTLHFRPGGAARSGDRSLFEIMDYRLTGEQLHRVLGQLRKYRRGPIEGAAYAAVRTLIGLRLTRPLGWIAHYQNSLRVVLGLK